MEIISQTKDISETTVEHLRHDHEISNEIRIDFFGFKRSKNSAFSFFFYGRGWCGGWGVVIGFYISVS